VSWNRAAEGRAPVAVIVVPLAPGPTPVVDVSENLASRGPPDARRRPTLT